MHALLGGPLSCGLGTLNPRFVVWTHELVLGTLHPRFVVWPLELGLGTLNPRLVAWTLALWYGDSQSTLCCVGPSPLCSVSPWVGVRDSESTLCCVAP